MNAVRVGWARLDVDVKRAVFVVGAAWTTVLLGALTLLVAAGDAAALIAWAVLSVGFAVMAGLGWLAVRLFPNTAKEGRR